MKLYLLPIHHEYAQAIYDKRKLYEIRKRIPNLDYGDIVFLYETAPVKKVTGFFFVDGFIYGSPDWLYRQYGKKCFIDYLNYRKYVGSRNCIYYVCVMKPHRLRMPISLIDIGITYHPQSWVSLDDSNKRFIRF